MLDMRVHDFEAKVVQVLAAIYIAGHSGNALHYIDGTIIRNVGEIDALDRLLLEHVLGQSLRENQQLVINIVNLQVPTGTAPATEFHKANGTSTLPEWCDVYNGLSEDEVAAMEQTILQRADLSRPSE